MCLRCVTQGADVRSVLRSARPAIVKIELQDDGGMQATKDEGERGVPHGGTTGAPQDKTELMSNFMTELESLTFFIEANHDENLLYRYSRVVFLFSFYYPLSLLTMRVRLCVRVCVCERVCVYFSVTLACSV